MSDYSFPTHLFYRAAVKTLAHSLTLATPSAPGAADSIGSTDTYDVLAKTVGNIRDIAPIAGVCAVCGVACDVTCPAPFSDVFTDYDKLRYPDSDRVCVACAFAFAESVNLPNRDKPQRIRNYSHFVVDGRWLYCTKGDKEVMQSVLFNPPTGPWLAVIAESGQKHILFRARVNTTPSPYVVQFEETRVTTTAEELRTLVEWIEALCRGFSKTMVRDNTYPIHTINRFGVDRWRKLEERIAPYRGTRLFALALFLARTENSRT